MESEKVQNYNRIEKAIKYITEHYKEQPSLDKIASEIGMSSFHFQRIFTEWAGVSPKKFIQYLSLKHAKKNLQEGQSTLFDTAYECGLSGTSRLHDLFVGIECMTPGEFKNGGKNLSICYEMTSSVFGNIIIASTEKGICCIEFCLHIEDGLNMIKLRFPKASFIQNHKTLHQNVINLFSSNWEKPAQIKLHLQGTDFQLKVWETLLKIPQGNVSTYGEIAHKIGNPKASRAVGSAIGKNPIAFIIPCHRVIQSSGNIGGYMWGENRKTAILGWESAQKELKGE